MAKDPESFSTSEILTFKFASPAAAEHFKSWLCESGEQQYWDWMQYREEDEEGGNITGLKFDYFQGSDIPVKCGRIDLGWKAEEDEG